MSDAIRIEHVTKTFGPKLAVSDLSLVVPRGALCGFIGPNGAGKTTTIRMIMSIIFPDSGRISVLGRDSALESKDRIGYLPEERGVYRKMKVGAFLNYIAKLKGIDRGAADAKVRTWLDRVGLKDVYKKKCEELSKGMQQKVQFISAVIHDPELVILDEVFTGLDPVNRKLMRELLDEQHRRGCTIIFSTHAMFEAEALCDQIFMIHEGKKVLDGQLKEVLARYDPHALLVEPVNGGDAPRLRRVKGVAEVIEAARGPMQVRLNEGADVQDAIVRIVTAVPLRRIEVKRATLDDVFIGLVEAAGGTVDKSALATPAQEAAVGVTP
ncbi:MAG: ABC transporter ATP-binding protein [Phycisphaerales bacterium]